MNAYRKNFLVNEHGRRVNKNLITVFVTDRGVSNALQGYLVCQTSRAKSIWFEYSGSCRISSSIIGSNSLSESIYVFSSVSHGRAIVFGWFCGRKDLTDEALPKILRE